LNEDTFCAAVLGPRTKSAAHVSATGWQRHDKAEASEVVVARGDPCRHLFVLCQGWAARYIQLQDGRRQILSILLPGDLFSATVLHDRLHRFSVRAITDIHFSRMDRDHIMDRVAADPEITRTLCSLASTELQTSDQLNTALGRCSAEQRLAYWFLHLSNRMKVDSGGRSGRYVMPLRHQDLADMTGLTPQYTSRLVKTFRDDGIVDWREGSLQILDQEKLERLGQLK
jgi:CRP-like cAMP-binding protein